MRYPAAFPALAFLCGVALGWRAPELAGWPVAACGLLAWAASLAALARPPRRWFVVAATVGFLTAGLLLGANATRAATRTSLAVWHEQRAGGPAAAEAVVVTGRLLRDALPADYGARLLVQVERVRAGGRELPLAGGVQVAVGGRFVAARRGRWVAGRRVRMPVLLRRPPRHLNPGVGDQQQRLAWRGVALLGSVKSALLVEIVEPGRPWQEASAAARAAVRRIIGRTVGAHSPRSAGVVTAVLIGDRAGLDRDTRRRLQEAGTYHVIAISGGNIAILTGVLLLILRLAGAPPRVAAVTVIVCLLAYWQIVGSEASVARATVVAATLLAARAADHRSVPLNTLAWSAVCLVAAAPLAVVDAGFLLTFGATLGILIGVPRLIDRYRSGPARADSWGMRVVWPLAGLLAATVCAELALLPIAASAFSRVTAAGLLLNFVAIPLMTVTQIAGMLAVTAAAVAPLVAGWWGYVAHLATTGIVESARLVDVVPQLTRRVPAPDLVVVAGYYGGWVLALAAGGRPALRAAGLALAAVAGVAVVAGASPRTALQRHCPGPAPLRVLFLDVDQADATLVQFPSGQSLLVDAAGSVHGRTAVGERVLAPVLWRAGVRRLDYLAVTHGDPDHAGGAPAVVRDFRPREIWEGVPVPRSERMRHLATEAAEAGAAWRRLRAGDNLRIGGVEVRVWHPPLPEWERPRVRNDDSLVVELRHDEVSFVLPGDIGTAVETELAALLDPSPQRVLKVPHHGSRTSSSAAFIAALDPLVAVVSAGRDNRFGHPHPAVLQRYAAAGTALLETGRVGAVDVCSDGRRIRVRTAHGAGVVQ